MVQAIMLATERSVSVAARLVALSSAASVSIVSGSSCFGRFTGYLDIASRLCCYAVGYEKF